MDICEGFTRSADAVVPLPRTKSRQNLVESHRRDRVTLKRHRIVIENTEDLSTAFIHMTDSQTGSFYLHQYSGNVEKEPTDRAEL
jgi:hypothetical protein